ncbi:hypothetical protein H8K35_10130 [Undibacterium sp. LX40W]|uniref:DUF4148 domain-containing protein n=1 Tax=Undibacterium nitidum TaxID=2762298 RepID=A0A923HM88_9BURK|nr:MULTISPECIES: hypothetical protein [Undibacterium]MBC3881989.1 hypothetical protein [Undibacterium nitidum]MBC3892015.1 hypothetical protein [Undibacterium sp. LX40W]
MKSITNVAIIVLFSLNLPAIAQQTTSTQNVTAPARIEQVQLKNGPLADFYELVSPRAMNADELAQKTQKDEQQVAANVKKAEVEKQGKAKKELDKLPQHSAK